MPAPASGGMLVSGPIVFPKSVSPEGLLSAAVAAGSAGGAAAASAGAASGIPVGGGSQGGSQGAPGMVFSSVGGVQ